MKPRNPYVRALFDGIRDEKLSSEERSRRVATSIATIVSIKPFHDAFKRNGGNIEPFDDIDLDLRDENDWTALTYAARAGYSGSVRLLLEAKANPCMPLIHAAYTGHTEIVRLLLEAKANPNTRDRKSVPALIFASQAGYTEIVRVLLKADANPNTPNEKGATALMLAANIGNAESVRLLLEAKANPNPPYGTSSTALILASQAGHTEIVRLLLKVDANPNTTNEKDGTALMLAAHVGDAESVRLLLEAKANPNARDGKSGPALIFASQADHTEIVRLLLKADANPNTSSKETGSTSLMYAAHEGREESVRLLLEAKADVVYLDRDGKSALDYAIEQNKLSTVLLLLRYNPNISNFEKICKFLASQDQSDPCVLECLKILSIKSKNITAVVPAPRGENEEFYLRKLTILHNAYKILFSYLIDESSGIYFPPGLALLMLDYDGRFFKPGAHVPPVRLFDLGTVNPHLDELKKEIRTSSLKPGLFTPIIREIDDAIALKSAAEVTVVTSPDAASSSSNRSQAKASRTHKCAVM